MYQAIKSKVGRKNTIYISKQIIETSGIKEGTKILIKAERGKLEIEAIDDPITLAIKSKKFAKVTIEEVEKISEEEQTRCSLDQKRNYDKSYQIPSTLYRFKPHR